MKDELGKKLGERSFLLLIGVLISLFVVNYFLGAGNQFLNVDEIELMRSVSDRILGVPQTSLAWPATTIQLILAPVVVGMAGFSVILDGNDAGLTRFLSGYIYASETHSVILRATLFLAIIFAISVVTKKIIDQKDRSKWLNVALLLCCSPIFISYSYMISGDGLAAILALASIVAVLSYKGNYFNLVASGALFGATVGCRATFLVYIPLMLVLVVQALRNVGTRNPHAMVWFISAFLVSLLIFLPSLWIDPVRLAKSILGNAGREGEGFVAIERYSNSLLQIGPLGLLIMIWSVVKSSAESRSRTIVLALYSVILLASINTLGVVYDRYYLMVLPLILGSIFASGLDVFNLHSSKLSLVYKILISVVFLVSVFYVTALNRSDVSRFKSPERVLSHLPNGQIVWVDVILLNALDMRKFTDESLREAMREILGGHSRSVISGKIGFDSGRDSYGLPFAFSEDEMATVARLKTAQRLGTGKLNLRVYGKGAFAERYGVTQFPPPATRGEIVLTLDGFDLRSGKIKKYDTLVGQIYTVTVEE
ncbi:hypothetical protein CCB80_07645 [Armatimonadetes bacterium Uphvl-Ar1]|nr:hypothetical protein CCB80_07645 [Armatimonadetes bacterium Uphvl-Ar1]